MLGTRSAGAVLLIALVACGESNAVQRDSEDLGYEGPYGIDSIDRSCTPGATDTWHVAVRTEGWAAAVDLLILAGEVQETHPLVNIDYDPGGQWDAWEITLLQAESGTDAQAGATTQWGCDDEPNLAWQVVMYAPDDTSVPADCAVWGGQANEAMQGPAMVECTCVDDDGCT